MSAQVKGFHRREFVIATPPQEEGYRGIFWKTGLNFCAAGGICMFASRLSLVAAVLEIVGLGLCIAVPFIAAKDLTHHTWRILTAKEEKTPTDQKITQAAQQAKTQDVAKGA